MSDSPDGAAAQIADQDASSALWPKTGRNKVRRYPERGRYEHEEVYRVLDAAILCNVAYSINGQPYCTPTTFWRDGDRLFWHGSSASRMLRTLSASTPACLTVSHLDGLILARAAFRHSINYRSVMAFGNAEILAERDKPDALRMFVDRFFPGRWEILKKPSVQEMKATTIITMRIDEASAKSRSGPPVDEEGDYGLPTWAGVIPFKTVVGDMIGCARLATDATPGPDLAHYKAGQLSEAVFSRAQSDAERLTKSRPGSAVAKA